MQLFNDDCLKVLPTIPNKSIDLILTDPPYGTTQCKWDFIIPFEPMWKELKRIIKDNGCIVLFGTEPFSSYLRLSNIKWFKYDWIWQKNNTTGFSLAKKQPMRNHEIISVFYKKQCNYNPQKTKGHKPANKSSSKSKKQSDIYGKFNKQEKGGQTDRYPKNIIHFNNVNSSKGIVHPTQKPIALMEYLIKTYTNEGETVLDFTMGSGSTGVACVNTKRSFIGIEQDDKYFDIAQERIDNAQRQSLIDFPTQ